MRIEIEAVDLPDWVTGWYVAKVTDGFICELSWSLECYVTARSDTPDHAIRAALLAAIEARTILASVIA